MKLEKNESIFLWLIQHFSFDISTTAANQCNVSWINCLLASISFHSLKYWEQWIKMYKKASKASNKGSIKRNCTSMKLDTKRPRHLIWCFISISHRHTATKIKLFIQIKQTSQEINDGKSSNEEEQQCSRCEWIIYCALSWMLRLMLAKQILCSLKFKCENHK